MSRREGFKNNILFFHQGEYRWAEVTNDILEYKLVEENRAKLSHVNSYFLGSYHEENQGYVILSCEISDPDLTDRGGSVGFHHVITHDNSYDSSEIKKALIESYNKGRVEIVASIYRQIKKMSSSETIKFLQERYIKISPVQVLVQDRLTDTKDKNVDREKPVNEKIPLSEKSRIWPMVTPIVVILFLTISLGVWINFRLKAIESQISNKLKEAETHIFDQIHAAEDRINSRLTLSKPNSLLDDAIVITDTLKLRADPGKPKPILRTYPKGTPIRKVLGKSDDSKWVKVEMSDGQIGWGFKESLQINIDLSNIPEVKAEQ